MVTEIIFSYTTLAALVFLVAVGLASYIGASAAIMRHLDSNQVSADES
ncbi:uncharacterized protein Nmag_1430 [Natrialba magadii ATCC 43099]|uniref:Uncharacterized protein n=1 Tax=Natrialba magadii (strain ATCC 43099 / DSM 3394 / CCM 3739 / CIP 104546 / IAM 13178 / JCM 8861 / NBRC 102185 / NCIMB 2190 / MS3) TaxID=547559 RepID=D3STJ2_NATMM|nr:hypothetical protein [Natrialba magadii]ADD05009.1 uncharacterized protein Nmag_1430 [Natrialba magadii ATCC 43099]ELY23383.1 hypothetical protein C500_19674 [Natrialba magadii ATCC 43099]